MKRKISFGITLVLMLSLLLLALTACGNKECEHSYSSAVTKAATCESDGVMTYTCSLCTDSYTEVIKALGHDEIKHDAKAPTCTEIGWDAYVSCSRCNYTTYAEKPALTHDEITHNAKAPTCTKIGWDAYVTCSRCDYTTYTPIEETGHSHNAVVTKPTCTEKGYTTHTCHCDDSYVDTYVDALGHTKVIDEAVAPTCTKTGLTEGSHCSVCGTVLVAQKAVEKLDHVYSEEFICNSTHHYYECECGSRKDEEKHISSGNASVTEDDVCTTCGYVITPASGFIFQTLRVEGSNVYGKVSNDTDFYSFLNEITTVGNAKYIVSRDVNGNNIISNKSISLNIGDNTVYITTYINDEPVALYKVVIRRRPIYTVNFDTNGGTSVETVSVEEDTLIKAPKTTRAGYTFSAWDYDFSAPIVSDARITAIWKPNADTKYSVEYYLENLDKTDYDLIDTTKLTGTTDTTAEALIKEFEHFTFNSEKSVESGNIDGNGELVLKVYYTRDTYNINTAVSDAKGGTVTVGGTYPYGTEIKLSATVNAGYTFLGYFVGDDNVCTSKDYTFTVSENVEIIVSVEANTDTKYTVEYYLENLDKTDYDLIDTTKLTGTTDTTAEAAINNYDHFTFNPAKSKLDGNIDGNGNLVLKVYYKRNVYSLLNGDPSYGSITATGNYAYESTEPFEVRALPYLGDEFIGWYSDNTLVSTDTTFIFTGERDITARFAIKPEMTKFNFTSSKSSCLITGVKNRNTTQIIVPDYVTDISEGAFSGCSNLESITIPFVGGNKIATSSSPSTLFGYIFGTTSYIDGIETKQSYGYSEYVIYYIPYSLTSVTITGNVILSNAFANCSGIKSVTIGNSVTGIASSAFENCTSLTSVTIPDGVTSIGSDAFRDCTELEEIYFNATAMNDLSSSNYVFYKAGKNGNGIKVVIGANVTKIPAYLFCPQSYSSAHSPKIMSVEFEEGSVCESIGNYAFYYCDSLTSITIPDGVTSIGNYAFYDCDSLTIYCEAASQPSGWSSSWNYSKRPVVWGYTGEEYTYNFVTNGAGAIESISSSVTVSLPTLEREGYHFMGWYDNAEFTGNPVNNPYYSATTHTLYAKWLTEEEYLASLDGTSFEKAYIMTTGDTLNAVVDTAGEYVYFVFTATESKTYTFQSNGSYDTFGYLYNSSQSQISSNNDSGDGSNFLISSSMSAGETVYLKVKLYSSSITGTFTVTVS